MGNLEIMKRGDLQMTSAGQPLSIALSLALSPWPHRDSLSSVTGTGIRHSEYNRNPSKQVHFLQIWALPNQRRLKPTYYTRHVTDEQKRSGLVRIVGPVKTEGVDESREAEGPAPVSLSPLSRTLPLVEARQTDTAY